jgi:hypothetical protein
VEKPIPLTVPPDNGKDYINQNEYQMTKRSILLPLFEAVQIVTTRKKAKSKFDWSSVDFAADSGSLRKLTAWANNKTGQWRMDIQFAGHKTVLINTWAPETKQTSGHPQSGYGFNFEKACTHPALGCENGIGHHRIIAYVRF